MKAEKPTGTSDHQRLGSRGKKDNKKGQDEKEKSRKIICRERERGDRKK